MSSYSEQLRSLFNELNKIDSEITYILPPIQYKSNGKYFKIQSANGDIVEFAKNNSMSEKVQAAKNRIEELTKLIKSKKEDELDLVIDFLGDLQRPSKPGKTQTPYFADSLLDSQISAFESSKIGVTSIYKISYDYFGEIIVSMPYNLTFPEEDHITIYNEVYKQYEKRKTDSFLFGYRSGPEIPDFGYFKISDWHKDSAPSIFAGERTDTYSMSYKTFDGYYSSKSENKAYLSQWRNNDSSYFVPLCRVDYIKQEFIDNKQKPFTIDLKTNSKRYIDAVIKSSKEIIDNSKIQYKTTLIKSVIDNCALRILSKQWTGITNEIPLRGLMKYFEMNGREGVMLKDFDIIATKLKCNIEIFTEYGFRESKTPFYTTAKNPNYKKLSILLQNSHARKFTTDFIKVEDIIYQDEMKPKTEAEEMEEIFNQSKQYTEYEKMYYDDETIISSGDDLFINNTTAYKKFRPSVLIHPNMNDIKNPTIKKYFREDSIAVDLRPNLAYTTTPQQLASKLFMLINKIKPTQYYKHLFKSACNPITKFQFISEFYSDKQYMQLDHNASYASSKSSKFYKGFPKNESQLIPCTSDYYEEIKESVALVYVFIYNCKSKHIQSTILKNRTKLWLPFMVFESIKSVIDYEISYVVTDKFDDLLLNEFREELPNLFANKQTLLICLGQLIKGGINMIDYADVSNNRSKIMDLTKEDYNLITHELDRDEIKYNSDMNDNYKIKCELTETDGKIKCVLNITNTISYDISYKTGIKKQSQHISSFIYGYSVAQMAEKIIKFEENNIEIYGIHCDAIIFNANDKDKVKSFSKISTNYGDFKIESITYMRAKNCKHSAGKIHENHPEMPKNNLLINQKLSKITVLNMPAGVGKSFSLFSLLPEKSIILAPTNIRCAAIQNELNQLYMNIKDKEFEIMTIHAYLGKSILKEGHSDLVGLDKFKDTQLRKRINHTNYLILDEFSMTSQCLIDGIIAKNMFNYMYILGDVNQCDLSFNLGVVDLEYFNKIQANVITDYKFHDLMRHEKEYHEFLTNCRNKVNDGGEEIYNDFKKKYNPKIINGSEINQYYNNSLMISPYHSDNQQYNSDYVAYQKERNLNIIVKDRKKGLIKSDKYDTKIKTKCNDGLINYVAFSLTPHSLQGATISQKDYQYIIIDEMCKYQGEFIYTALTRVKSPEQIIFYERNEEIELYDESLENEQIAQYEKNNL